MYKINQGTTARISFTITDYDGVPVPFSNISTATMSIVDYDSNSVIISGQNIKPNITESGVCTVYLSGDTNKVLDENKPYEKHIIFVTVSGVGGSAPQITHEVIVQINNLRVV